MAVSRPQRGSASQLREVPWVLPWVSGQKANQALFLPEMTWQNARNGDLGRADDPADGGIERLRRASEGLRDPLAASGAPVLCWRKASGQRLAEITWENARDARVRVA